MSVLSDLTTRRRATYEALQSLLNDAESARRDLTRAEDAEYRQLTEQLDRFDERIAELRDEDERRTDATAAFSRISGGPGRRGVSPDEAEYAKAFASAIRAKNPAPIEIYDPSPRSHYQPGLEHRDLLKTTATQAMPVSVYNRIVSSLVESSAVIAAGATVITTSTGEDLQVPKGTAFSTSALTAEGAPITESDATLAVATLKAYKYATFFQVSSELANDTPTDLLNYLARQAGMSLALAFGPHLMTGTGSGQPSGLVTGATLGVTGPTGTATSLGTQATAGQGTDLLYSLIGSLAEPYSRQPSTGFIMPNSSLAIARKLKDSAGQPVAGMVGGGLNAAVSGAPSGHNVVLGYPTFVDPNVAAMAANAKSILFGDMSRYFVRIVNGIRFERSDDFAFQNDLVSFRCIIRLDGSLVDANAVKYFQNSAT